MDGRTETTKCPACGSVLLRYDTRRQVIVCMMCGRPVNQLEILRRRQQYHRNIQLAKEYIQVNNYSSALNILKNMQQDSPTSVELYRLMLCCLTEKGHIYLEDSNDLRLSECIRCWEALKNLPGGIDEKWKEYGNRRVKLSENKLGQLKIKITVMCLISAVFAICGYIQGEMNLFYVLSGIMFAILYKTGWISKCRNMEKKLADGKNNPFYVIL